MHVHVHVHVASIDVALFIKIFHMHARPGATKVLTCAENWIAAGSNSGTVNSLDLRNREFLCMWRPSEFPSAQVHMYNYNNIACLFACTVHVKASKVLLYV